MIGLIIVEIIVVIALIIYNISINKNIKKVELAKEQFKKLVVLKKLTEITSTSETVENKLKQINDLVVDEFKIEYSTFIIFNGKEYTVKASNIPMKVNIDKITGSEIFKILENEYLQGKEKYITAETNLEYNNDGRNIKSALFIPIVYNEKFMGIMLVESEKAYAFDNINMELLNTVKQAVLELIYTLSYEKTLQTYVKKDELTKLYSNEYMLTKGKYELDKYDESILTMIKLSDVLQINNMYGREVGNKVISKVITTIQTVLESENIIFVRYYGIKFLIAFLGMNEQKHQQLMEKLKQELSKITIYEFVDEEKLQNEENKKETEQQLEDKNIEDEEDNIDEILENNKNTIKSIKPIQIAMISTKYIKYGEIDIIAKYLENKL